jgi:hypothetical protein
MPLKHQQIRLELMCSKMTPLITLFPPIDPDLVGDRYLNGYVVFGSHRARRWLSDRQRDCKHTPVLALLAREVEGCGRVWGG